MKKLKLLIFIPILLITFCKKQSEPSEPIPGCIDMMIDDQVNVPCINSGASVSQYLFQGDYVYLFDPGKCDVGVPHTLVFNSKCIIIGEWGGSMENKTINGILFYPNAKLIK
jgi:hypothetical protein